MRICEVNSFSNAVSKVARWRGCRFSDLIDTRFSQPRGLRTLSRKKTATILNVCLNTASKKPAWQLFRLQNDLRQI